jgi:hypothetical protein
MTGKSAKYQAIEALSDLEVECKGLVAAHYETPTSTGINAILDRLDARGLKVVEKEEEK